MAFLNIPGLSQPDGFGPFHSGQRIAVVMDHPSLDDIKTLRPLQGTYGSTFNQCISQCGLIPSQCTIYYVFPQSEGIAAYWSPKTGFTSKGSDHVMRLISEIQRDTHNVIVPMGEVPLQALTNCKGITKWRNSILECKHISGKKVIPTICPKTATREYLYRYHIVNDMKRVEKESYSPVIDLPKRSIKINPTFDESMAYLQNIKTNKLLNAFDIEVHKGEVSCIAFAISPLDGISIPFNAEHWTIEEESRLWLMISDVLGDPSIDHILQNATFDINFLMRKNKIITRGYIHDTMIKHNLNYPDFPKNLGFICSIYTREPYYKDEGKESFRGPIRDFNQYYTYNCKDALITFEANIQLTQDLELFGNTPTYDFNQRLMQVLFYMMSRGICVDKDKLASHKTTATAEMKELQQELNTIAGFDFNVASPTQCKKYFYDIKGFKPITALKKGTDGTRTSKVTTDNKAMKRIAMKGCKEATLVQKIRGYRKLIGTYLNITFDPDDRLRCSFNISGTSSGRLSSSETIFGTGTNMQNLPKVFKEFLVADQEVPNVNP